MVWLAAVPSMDWIYTTALILGLLALVFIAEIASRKNMAQGWVLRKAVHIFTGILVVCALLILTSVTPLLMVAGGFALLNMWSILNRKFRSFNETPNRSLGTFYYPLSLCILLLLFWPEHQLAVLIGFSLMAFADAIAGIVGRQAPASAILALPGDTKSVHGSAALFVSSVLVVVAWLFCAPHLHHFSLGQSGLIVFVVAAVATAAEALSFRGSDNLSVPLLTALLLYAFDNPALPMRFLNGVLLAGGVVLLSWRLRLLDLSGALAGFLVGAVTFGAGGWPFTIPMLLFFGFSNVIAKVLKSESKDHQRIIEKGGRRDAKQVLANGFLPAVVVLATFWVDAEWLFVLYLSGLAAATADTWATEIGMAFSAKPRSILTGKLVPVGESGGVTFSGTAGAVLAAIFMAGFGWVVGQFWPNYGLSSIVFVIIAISAILAQVLDSVLGATVQRKNRCTTCGKITERHQHCNATTQHEKGLSWMDNDAVNLFCSLSGIFFSYIAIKYLLN